MYIQLSTIFNVYYFLYHSITLREEKYIG